MATASSTAQQAISKKPFDGFDNIFLNGKWRHGSSDQTYDDTNPYTNEVLVRIHLANEGDLNEAFHAARSAQPNWCRMLPAERSKILRRAADIMEERREEIVGWLIRESGSTRIKANVEWQYAHGITLEAATFPSRIEGPIMPCDIPGKENRVYRHPSASSA
jgi:aldehyde dehydrogenase (NAD+)